MHVRNCQVEVRSPWHVSQREIDRFMEQQADWVERTLAQQEQQAREAPDIRDGGRIWYKARECRVVFVESAQSGVSVEGREFRIHGRGLRQTPGRAERILRDWLMQQARQWLVPRTEALVRHMDLQSRFREVVLRKTRSKWGHCTVGGRIQYNWLLMLAPDGVIDYMICHEVCHLVHMDHSAAYWQCVARYCPDYRRYRDWLKTCGHRIWIQEGATQDPDLRQAASDAAA